jgi:hypothetical protein
MQKIKKHFYEHTVVMASLSALDFSLGHSDLTVLH